MPQLTRGKKVTFTLLFVLLLLTGIIATFYLQSYYAQRHPVEQVYYTQETQDEEKWRATLPELGLAETQTQATSTWRHLVGNFGEYYQHDNELYYGGVLVPVDPSTFHSGKENCNQYAIADGYVLIRSRKTEIPESVCAVANLDSLISVKNTTDTYIYKGETRVYLFTSLGDDWNFFTQIGELNSDSFVQVGTSTEPLVFADDSHVVRVDSDSYDGPSEPRITMIDGILPETTRVLNELYLSDGYSVYVFGTKIPSADPQTFELLGPLYARDKDTVFFAGISVLGADVRSFEVVSDPIGGFISPSHSVARDDGGYWNGAKQVLSIPKKTTLYSYERINWADPNIYFSDGSYLYAYNSDSEGLLKTKVPTNFLESTQVKMLPGNVKLMHDYELHLQCSSAPSLTYVSSSDYSNKVSITVDEEELSKFCRLCTRCDRN